MLVGQTGAGKSTTINFLRSKKKKKIKIFYNRQKLINFKKKKKKNF
jgi:putative ribosome biogenesis GTPase RsgA